MSATSGPVKSLLISGEYFPPVIGGISTFMASMVEALGPERMCCLTGVEAKALENFNIQGVGLYRRPRVFSRSSLLEGGAWLAAVAEIMLKERPKAVQLATLYDGHLGMWMQKWLRLPYLVYAHGNEVLNALQAQWEGHRLALQKADRVLANSRYTADLVKQCGVEEDRIAIVHPGCDAKEFRPIRVSSDDRQALLGRHAASKVILTVGRLVRRKGQDKVIRALPRILEGQPATCYLVAGDGPEKQALAELSERVGVADKVIFLEQIDNTALLKLYNLCDVFAMPSREDIAAQDVEGFGIVYLEANACGKPVIGGRSGGMADAIVDGVTGMLVPHEDHEALAVAISRLLGDEALNRRMGDQGRDRVVREFSWQFIADRVAAIVSDLVIASRRVV